ncbi:MAG: alanine dehydrogenase [Armatimonadetes bacterium]|nr:alanine dehydrogenase [Armatimonadota bacterium]
MVIGVPKEIKEGENRVAVTPYGVHALVQRGHVVLVEEGAGQASGITDDAFAESGAKLVGTAAEVWNEAEMVLKVKEPLPEEYEHLRPGLTIFTYLHLASDPELTRVLLERDVIAVGYETVQLEDGSLPLLAPMSEVAGRLCPQIGAALLQANSGGRGILLSGVPGVPPADVVVVGCGTVGTNAAVLSAGMGAQVTIIDVNHRRLKYIDDVMHGRVITMYSTPLRIAEAIRYADLVIGAVLVPGARAPVIITEEMVASMKPGSVIIDVAVDQGGCVETTRPTTHSNPTYTLHGVIHYAVPNMPAAVPRTATFALTNATLPYVMKIADMGLDEACRADPSLARGINVYRGEIRHPAVRESFSGAQT